MIKDRTGIKYERLTAIRFVGMDNSHHALWECKCDCGNLKIVSSAALGKTKSCGCLNRENILAGNNRRMHGGCGTRLYRIWQRMHTRCYNKNTSDYQKWYQNISICDEWLHDFSAFKNWSMANGYNDSLSIDRIDPMGDYCPQNCRWADATTQANNKRDNRIVVVKGNKYKLTEACKIFNVPKYVFYQRLKRGMSDEEALTTPIKTRKRGAK